MAQIKAHEVDRWLDRPDPAIRMVLVYGPHRGLVAEQAARYARSTGIAPDDPFAVIRLEPGAIAGDPGRLIDELLSVPMFGGNRLVWIRDAGGAGKEVAAALETLASTLPEQSFLLAEAGDLKKGAPLRKAFEDSPAAMALPCYDDDVRALDRLLDEALSAAAQDMTLAARQALRTMISGDRLAARAEIEKLLLYCHGQERIDVEDVLASAGDISSLSLDGICDLVLAGQLAGFDRAYARAVASGVQPQAILASLSRQLQMLQLLRHKVEHAGVSPRDAVAAARPPIFFSRRNQVAAALAALDGASLTRMLARVRQATLASRSGGALAAATVHRTLLSLGLEIARGERRAS
jgi:DNA polymerase-3 subunit delta